MKQSTLHVAIIMDGNGRWANRRALPRLAGHRAGAETLRRVVRAAPGLGIVTLTAFAFSADNWRRPADEVAALMALLTWYFGDETPRLIEGNVRLSVVGRRDRLPVSLCTAIESAEVATQACQGLHLRLAIDYSSREAILRAACGPGMTRERFETLLEPCGPVDLLIRTGGEQRLSDFLLWECAYAELLFTRRMWPEFDASDLREAVEEFRLRDRRFGAIPPDSIPNSMLDSGPDSGPAIRERWLR
jgi:undecaprenyl diphosphate synthase